jgi:hypothetical protein
MSSSLAVPDLLIVAQKYTLEVNFIMFVAGVVGNVLNIFLFTKLKVFRNNRCAFYLIMESVASIAMLLIYFLPEIFQLLYGTDPMNLSLIYCKIKPPFSQFCRLMIGSIVCFEAFDQFLSTHHQFYLRQMSTLKLARWLIFAATILWSLHAIPFIVFYEIVPLLGCVITNQPLKQYYAFVYYIFINGLLPISITTLLSLLAYRNVRNLVRRQIPIERRRLDRQLTAMVFARIIVFVILSLPYTIYRIYLLNNIVSTTDSLSYDINQLVTAIVGSLLIWIYSVRYNYI